MKILCCSCPALDSCPINEDDPENKKKLYMGLALLILSFGCFLIGLLGCYDAINMDHQIAYGLAFVGGLPFYVSVGAGIIALIAIGITKCRSTP